MGRQHTTWISDETWERLKNIEGKSVSARIANAVKAADPDHEMIIKARMRQLRTAKDALRQISLIMSKEIPDTEMLTDIDQVIDQNAHLFWEAHVDA